MNYQYPSKPDKPFIDYADMVNNLTARNIIVNDKSFAEHILRSFSYYTIVNGYKSAFTGGQCYPDPIKLEELVAIHLTSTELSNVLLKSILSIEKTFKSNLSYIIAKDIGVCTDLDDMKCLDTRDYLCKCYYKHMNGLRDSTLKGIKEWVNDKPTDSLTHYKNNKNHVPPWILVNSIPLGHTINWFSILCAAEKDYIASQYLQHTGMSLRDKKEFLKSALKILKVYRNAFAHSGRTIGINCSEMLSRIYAIQLSFGALSKRKYIAGYGKSDLTALIICILNLAATKYDVSMFRNDMHSIFDEYINRSITICGKPYLSIFGFLPNLMDMIDAIIKARGFTL